MMMVHVWFDKAQGFWDLEDITACDGYDWLQLCCVNWEKSLQWEVEFLIGDIMDDSYNLDVN